jgi:hypothetical protein
MRLLCMVLHKALQLAYSTTLPCKIVAEPHGQQQRLNIRWLHTRSVLHAGMTATKRLTTTGGGNQAVTATGAPATAAAAPTEVAAAAGTVATALHGIAAGDTARARRGGASATRARAGAES